MIPFPVEDALAELSDDDDGAAAQVPPLQFVPAGAAYTGDDAYPPGSSDAMTDSADRFHDRL
jgi:hypothetical protein